MEEQCLPGKQKQADLYKELEVIDSSAEWSRATVMLNLREASQLLRTWSQDEKLKEWLPEAKSELNRIYATVRRVAGNELSQAGDSWEFHTSKDRLDDMGFITVQRTLLLDRLNRAGTEPLAVYKQPDYLFEQYRAAKPAVEMDGGDTCVERRLRNEFNCEVREVFRYDADGQLKDLAYFIQKQSD